MRANSPNVWSGSFTLLIFLLFERIYNLYPLDVWGRRIHKHSRKSLRNVRKVARLEVALYTDIISPMTTSTGRPFPARTLLDSRFVTLTSQPVVQPNPGSLNASTMIIKRLSVSVVVEYSAFITCRPTHRPCIEIRKLSSHVAYRSPTSPSVYLDVTPNEMSFFIVHAHVGPYES